MEGSHKMHAKIRFMNIEIDNLSMGEAVDAIDALIERNSPSFVVTPNADHLVLLEKNVELQQAYAHADLCLADGMPVIWAAKLYRTPIKEKVSGADLFPQLCEKAAQKKYKMFFLGAKDGVAEIAAQKLRSQYPDLQIVGTYAPPMHFEEDSEEMQKVTRMILDAKPHILVVALGCPKQEILMDKYRDVFRVPVSIGVGGTLNFVAGTVKRAPKWMSNHGLEWLYRMRQEPRRLFKRYVLRDWHFFRLFLKYLHVRKD